MAASVNGVAPTVASVQALVAGGAEYPLATKLYLNSVRGFQNLHLSDPFVPAWDAEEEMARCFTAAAGAPLIAARGLVPLPGPALREDFNHLLTCGGPPAVNSDACESNPAGIPQSSCSNGWKDGAEIGVDVCPTTLPACAPVSARCYSCADGIRNGDETAIDVCPPAWPTCNPVTKACF